MACPDRRICKYGQIGDSSRGPVYGLNASTGINPDRMDAFWRWLCPLIALYNRRP